MISVEWLIARRYLFSRERKMLVSLISLISVAGVAVGVAALLIVIGVIDGIDDMLFRNFASISPHVRIRAADGKPFTIDGDLLRRLGVSPGVELARPVIEKQVILQNSVDGQSVSQLIKLIGADTLGPGTLYSEIGEVGSGRQIQLPGAEPETGRGFILVGRQLYLDLNLQYDKPVLLQSTNPVSTALGPVLPKRKETVYGSFVTRIPDLFDSQVAFVSEREIRDFYHMAPGTADYIQVKLKNPLTADRFAAGLNLPAARYKVTTWIDENSDFFGALTLERLGLWLILLLIILVAALNIVGTLILMVIEKTRAVGILRAFGASEHMVARIFLLDGIAIGLLGTLIGTAVGITGCLLIPKINLPATFTIHLSVMIKPLSVALVVAASLAICTLAGLFPARQAAKLNPVEALRYD